METVFLFGICSRQRREGFQPWDLFPTTSGRFPASGFAPDNVGKVSSLGICSRQRREGFQLRDLFPTTSGRFPASGFVPDNVRKVSSFGICSRRWRKRLPLVCLACQSKKTWIDVAIPCRILVQIVLMILLGRIKVYQRFQFNYNRSFVTGSQSFQFLFDDR